MRKWTILWKYCIVRFRIFQKDYDHQVLLMSKPGLVYVKMFLYAIKVEIFQSVSEYFSKSGIFSIFLAKVFDKLLITVPVAPLAFGNCCFDTWPWNWLFDINNPICCKMLSICNVMDLNSRMAYKLMFWHEISIELI